VTSVKDKMGLSHTKEIENAIAEVNDVLKTYRTLMKQTEEASKYLQKWGVASEHAELIAAFGLSATQSDAHKGALVALCDVIQNDYLKVLGRNSKDERGAWQAAGASRVSVQQQEGAGL
jgi:hypothetical protein